MNPSTVFSSFDEDHSARISIHRHCWKKVHKIRKPYTTFKGNLSKASKDILLHNLAKVLQYVCVYVCLRVLVRRRGGGEAHHNVCKTRHLTRHVQTWQLPPNKHL